MTEESRSVDATHEPLDEFVVDAGDKARLHDNRHVRGIAGESTYRLVAVGLRTGTAVRQRLLRLFGRLLQADANGPPGSVAATFHQQRVRDLTPLERARTRLWLAAGHRWRTRFAGFDWYVTARVRDKDVSIAGVVDRAGVVGGSAAQLGLLGGVYTPPAFRGRGLASEVVRRSTRLIEELGCDYGVLTCGDDLVPFYERVGWKHVTNAMTFERFGVHRSVDIEVMVYACGSRPFPAGTIDVMGLPV